MSAICGVVGVDGRPWSEADLGGVMAALAPLGADRCGVWAGSAGPLGVAVGAALRQRTPEDAADAQPALAGDLVLVGDLRIDNREELASLLSIAHGPEVPDSAIALAAYARWGEAMPERLVGAYALAVIDRRRGGVLLARDHLGLEPLVVHERPGVVAFASTALSLTALEGVGHRLDSRRAAEVLALAYNSERTFVEGVRWLPPGGAMWVGAGGTRRWQWWRPELHATRDGDAPEAFDEEMRELIDMAVTARLRSAGRVGAMTSGGLDSTSVSATAARLLAPEPLPTYTSAPPPGWGGSSPAGWDADESPLVCDLAALHPNMAPRFVHVEPGGGLFAHHEALWELGAGPERNPCNSLWLDAVMARAAGDGVATLLTGQRGNFFFSAAGPDAFVALLRSGRPLLLVRELAAWSRRARQPWRRTLREQLLAPLQPPWLRHARRVRSGAPAPVDEWISYTALRGEPAAELELEALLPQLDERRAPDRRANAMLGALFAGAQAEMGLAGEALTGVELRDPTADRRLIEAALRQPEWVRRRDGIGRAVARNAMAGRLPRSIAQRRRLGEQLPDWLDIMSAARGELAAEVDAMGDHAQSRELIDVERLRRMLDSWPEPHLSSDRHTARDYRYALFRAALVSRYMRWFERR